MLADIDKEMLLGTAKSMSSKELRKAKRKAKAKLERKMRNSKHNCHICGKLLNFGDYCWCIYH